jgi:hypothetical protein
VPTSGGTPPANGEPTFGGKTDAPGGE